MPEAAGGGGLQQGRSIGPAFQRLAATSRGASASCSASGNPSPRFGRRRQGAEGAVSCELERGAGRKDLFAEEGGGGQGAPRAGRSQRQEAAAGQHPQGRAAAGPRQKKQPPNARGGEKTAGGGWMDEAAAMSGGAPDMAPQHPPTLGRAPREAVARLGVGNQDLSRPSQRPTGPSRPCLAGRSL